MHIWLMLKLDFCCQSGRDELGSDIRALKKKITGEEED